MADKPTDDEIYGGPLDMPDDDYRPPSPHKQRKPLPLVVMIPLAVIAVGLIGFGIWTFATNGNDTVGIEQNAEVATEDAAPDPSADGADVSTNFQLETTRTTNPRMEVTYPDTWTLLEEGDAVWLESPDFTFTTTNGEHIDSGHFKVYMRQGAREVDSNYIGRGVAALPSEQITYTDPAIGQREDTFLQFFGFEAGNHIALFMVAGNFELSPGDTLGPDYGRDGDAYIIVGGYSSDELEDDIAMYQMSIDYFQSTNAYEQAIEIIRSLRLL